MATFKRLQELGDEVVEQVDQMLNGGETPTRVAKWLQGELGLLTDLKESSLKKNLERYRSKDLKKRLYETVVDLHRGKSVAGIQRQLIALDGLNDAALIQKSRVEKILAKEGQLPVGILLKQASDEMRLFKEMLVELGKMQLETGVMRRAPKTTTGSTFDPETGQEQQFSFTEEWDKLYAKLEHSGGVLIEGKVVEDVEIADKR